MKKTLLIIIFFSQILFLGAQTPTLQWAKNFGGSLVDQCQSITVDVAGNVYTVGSFLGTIDFDPNIGVTNLSSTVSAFFVTKLNSAGDLVWAKNVGGSTTNAVTGIALDITGNIYVTGSFSGTSDFDSGSGGAYLTSAGDYDIFICKINANGGLILAKSIGGTLRDEAYGIAIDLKSNIYLTGYFNGTANFETNGNTLNLTSAGMQDAFVSKLDKFGNLIWAKNIGGTETDYSYSIAVDTSGNVYSTGSFSGTADFDPNSGTYSITANGNQDVFISKLNKLGNFVWAKNFNGPLLDNSYSITVDILGNVYTTGTFNGTVDFNPGSGFNNLISAGLKDIFVSKLDPSGNYMWARNLGGTLDDVGYGISIDDRSNVYTTGWFNGISDFDPSVTTYSLATSGSSDIFISKLDSVGDFLWAVKMGGAAGDYGISITANDNNVYTAGWFNGVADFDPSSAAFNLTSKGLLDGFVHKMGSNITSVNEIVAENIATIFPNPFNDLLTIQFFEDQKNCFIKLFDVLGKEIRNVKFTGQQFIIPKEELTNGIYFLQIIDSKSRMITKKIIVD